MRVMFPLMNLIILLGVTESKRIIRILPFLDVVLVAVVDRVKLSCQSTRNHLDLSTYFQIQHLPSEVLFNFTERSDLVF